MASQQPDAEEMDSKILNAPLTLVQKERRTMSEFDCANVVVVTPLYDDIASTAVEQKMLPVIVWAHGGAYKVG